MKKYIVSFPHMGNYYIPIYNLFKNILDENTTEILVPKKNSNLSLEKGSLVSPEFICTPFKYNMGNYIESLEMGANVLVQVGGGCRYGYYSELQEQILKDLGYKFTFITLSDANGINIPKIYKKVKILNSKITFVKFVSCFLLTIDMLKFLDEIETYIRENIVYEVNKGEFKKYHEALLKDMKNIKNKKEFLRFKNKYSNIIKNVKLQQKDVIKIGIVGELYSLMEPFANFNLEEKLENMNIKVRRYTTATYLLFEKGEKQKEILENSKSYIEHLIGADGAESVSHSLELISDGYDGIIHVKPFSCTPEINAMPILQKIQNDYNIPIMYLTFDTNTTSEGFMTRIEAFVDMLKMKKEKELEGGKICQNII